MATGAGVAVPLECGRLLVITTRKCGKTKKGDKKMRKQWREFVEENQCYWSYGIVPSLVKRLDAAQKAGDQESVKEALDALATQGVVLGKDGNLYFFSEIATSLLQNWHGNR